MNFHFDGAVAEMYGVDGAVFISRLQFWIEKNAANDRHYHEGRYWTYNSLRAMEKLFPFWSRRQIERIVKNLKIRYLTVDGCGGIIINTRCFCIDAQYGCRRLGVFSLSIFQFSRSFAVSPLIKAISAR